jgi:O-methyltransferase
MVKKHIINIIQRILSTQKLVLSRNIPTLGRDRNIVVNDGIDYVRVSSLELVANEIYEKNISGNTAELGVFKGDFSSKINSSFPDRKLYLFDTFEGFDKRDILKEVEQGFSDGKQDFSNTSVDNVLSKMSNPSLCIVKKGFFPQTAESLEDTFAFVSIDTDLFEPIYQGLKYFYPRLSKGGFIFIHDYNNNEYTGAKVAVRKYCEENELSFFPMSDNWGSVAITK